jgi:putative heme iron utilization protein
MTSLAAQRSASDHARVSPEEKHRLRRLLRDTRWVALGTARDNEPFASWVAFAAEPSLDSFLLHLSHLALHTRYIETNPRAALTLSELDDGRGDPQQLARVSLQGRVTPIGRDDADYARARAHYLARLPTAEQNFGLDDFALYRFLPETGRYVPGFGRVHRLDPEVLRALAREGE